MTLPMVTIIIIQTCLFANKDIPLNHPSYVLHLSVHYTGHTNMNVLESIMHSKDNPTSSPFQLEC